MRPLPENQQAEQGDAAGASPEMRDLLANFCTEGPGDGIRKAAAALMLIVHALIIAPLFFFGMFMYGDGWIGRPWFGICVAFVACVVCICSCVSAMFPLLLRGEFLSRNVCTRVFLATVSLAVLLLADVVKYGRL